MRELLILLLALCLPAYSQQEAPHGRPAPLTERERQLLDRIERLEQRIAELERRVIPAGVIEDQPDPPPNPLPPAIPPPPISPANDRIQLGGVLDTYYGYNFNQPPGGVNQLRAYDVFSNRFSLNQATFIVDRRPDPDLGSRFGMRVDLMYGQATETLQGNPRHEPRPQVYRPVFQAYGTYVVPLGRGLTVDFGKWASSVGFEGNYTREQINYSRSYWFAFLPFYHFGARTNYDVNNSLSLGYWLVNGIEQSEDFNQFKSQAALAHWKPTQNLSWQLLYYVGREQRTFAPGGDPPGAIQPDIPATPILPVPNGRTHIWHTYADWQTTPKLRLVGEGAFYLERVFATSRPGQTYGGAAYAQYRFTRNFTLGGRLAYMNDRNGLFSSVPQRLLDTTATASFNLGQGLQVRLEFRNDHSNRDFFVTGTPGLLRQNQPTAILGMIWTGASYLPPLRRSGN